MTKTVADVMKLVKEKECTFVDFRFVDTKGKERQFQSLLLTKTNLRAVMHLTVHLLLVGRVLKLLTCC
jgi:glutamine synthetase